MKLLARLLLIIIWSVKELFSMVVYCSIITPPSRFVSRERVFCMTPFHAFQYMQEKYHRVLNWCPDALVLVENSKTYTYFNWIGVDVTNY